MNRQLLSAAFFISIISAFAFRFPVNQADITATFGESRGDHFHTGIDLKTRQQIFPVADGEIIFYRDFSENPTIPIPGIGNHIVIQHENNLRSYYMHLESGSLNSRLTHVSEYDVIAMMGSSGRSTGEHLHLGIEDIQKNTMINPLKYLPEYTDRGKPEILNMCFKTHSGKLIYLRPHMLMLSQNYKIFIKAWDIRSGHEEMRRQGRYYSVQGIKRITLLIDDEVVRDYDFTFLINHNNKLFVFPDYSFQDVYGENWYYRFGDFTPVKKSHVFKARCEDWSGNTDTKSVMILFK